MDKFSKICKELLRWCKCKHKSIYFYIVLPWSVADLLEICIYGKKGVSSQEGYLCMYTVDV